MPNENDLEQQLEDLAQTDPALAQALAADAAQDPLSEAVSDAEEKLENELEDVVAAQEELRDAVDAEAEAAAEDELKLESSDEAEAEAQLAALVEAEDTKAEDPSDTKAEDFGGTDDGIPGDDDAEDPNVDEPVAVKPGNEASMQAVRAQQLRDRKRTLDEAQEQLVADQAKHRAAAANSNAGRLSHKAMTEKGIVTIGGARQPRIREE